MKSKGPAKTSELHPMMSRSAQQRSLFKASSCYILRRQDSHNVCGKGSTANDRYNQM
jgi:hypothetical protein